MKRLLTITAVMLLIATFGFTMAAQDVLYLKNGSVIRGTVLEQSPDKDLKFQTYDGSIYVYPMADVERITKESSQGSNTTIGDNITTTIMPTKSAYEKKGIKLDFDIAWQIGVGAAAHTDDFMLGLGVGWRFNPYIYVGLGLMPSLRWYAYRGYSKVSFVLPMYVTARASLPLKQGLALVLETRNGWGGDFSKDGPAGFYNREMLGVMGGRSTFGITYNYFMKGHYIGLAYGFEF